MKSNLEKIPKMTGRVEKVIKKMKLEDTGSDFKFWQQQSPETRLQTLETIRQEYNSWKYDTQPGFQRVYSIVKRK